MKLKYRILSVIVPITIIFDQITKQIIVDKFKLGESIPVIMDYFSITYVRNTGAAFGFMADAPPALRVPFFFTIPLVALFIVGGMFKKLSDSEKFVSTALSLVIGGAIGNLIDRVRFG